MAPRRVLLMHITTSSGHQRASQAIESTFHRIDPEAKVFSVDAFEYTSPVVRWAIHQIYFSLIRHQPDVWEYLYDNPSVHRRVQWLRALLHQYQAKKFKALLDQLKPDVIACTQAYPCGMVAAFKEKYGLHVPLVGVLTDYAPHLYWFHSKVDAFVVPSESVKQTFIDNQIPESRVKVLGIPVSLDFRGVRDSYSMRTELGLDSSQPIILVMGGGGGFGKLWNIVQQIDMLPQDFQMVVLTGSNKPLLRKLRVNSFRHKVIAHGYRNDVHKFMSAATLIISKPGGLTTAEALVTQTPMVVVDPIPGQEDYNTQFLVSQGAAALATSAYTVRQTTKELLDHPERIERMRLRMQALAKPDASLDVVELLMSLTGNTEDKAVLADSIMETSQVS